MRVPQIDVKAKKTFQSLDFFFLQYVIPTSFSLQLVKTSLRECILTFNEDFGFTKDTEFQLKCEELGQEAVECQNVNLKTVKIRKKFARKE